MHGSGSASGETPPGDSSSVDFWHVAACPLVGKSRKYSFPFWPVEGIGLDSLLRRRRPCSFSSTRSNSSRKHGPVGLVRVRVFDLGDGGLEQPGALGVGEHGVDYAMLRASRDSLETPSNTQLR